MKKLLTSFLLTMLFSQIFGQNVDIKYEYKTWTGCNVFKNIVNVNGLEHLTSVGRPSYTDDAIVLQCNKTGSSTNIGFTMYSIKYNFKIGYKYTIKALTRSYANGALTLPSLGVQFNVGNYGIDTANDCIGPTSLDVSNKFTASLQISDGNNYGWRDIATNQLITTNNISHLIVQAYCNGASNINLNTQKIYIRTIQIVEIPPTFTLTPTSIQIPCGTTVTKTFKAKNTDNVAGTLSYNWDLGSSNNGWLYNGSPAPQFISTNVDSIKLTSTTPSDLVKNVSVTVILNGTALSTLTSIVSSFTSTSGFSIIGENSFCATSNSYSITYLPPNATVVWSAIPADAVTINTPNSLQTTITKEWDANVTLIATVTSSCGNVILQKQNITVGLPTIMNGNYACAVNGINSMTIFQDDVNTNEVCVGTTFVDFTSPIPSNATWSLIYGNPDWWNWLPNYKELVISMPEYEQALFRLNFPTTCGTAQFDFSFATGPASRILNNIPKPKLKLSPNPSTSFVNISITDLEMNKKALKSIDFSSVKLIAIYDKFGNLQMKMNKVIPKQGLQVNIANLKPNEVYTIIVEDKKGLKLNGKIIKL